MGSLGAAYLRHRRVSGESVPDCLLYRGEHSVAAAETHLGLGWVYIHIHLVVVERYVDHCQRVAPLLQEAVISLFQSVAEHAALHPATVDEEAHVTAVRPAERGLAYHAADGALP